MHPSQVLDDATATTFRVIFEWNNPIGRMDSKRRSSLTGCPLTADYLFRLFKAFDSIQFYGYPAVSAV